MLSRFSLFSFIIASILLSACARPQYYKDDVAMRIATPAWLIKRPVEADPYLLTAFERMHKRNTAATLYIEGAGDGAFKKNVLFDPTPKNPLALHLAAYDKALNVAYIARPCQYTGFLDNGVKCDAQNLQDTAYSAETLRAYDTVLNGIKSRYGITNFKIVGYDSGATLAALLAARRSDIISLHTVAGDFDIGALAGSTAALSRLPQHHFIGDSDNIIPQANLQAYLRELTLDECASFTVVEDASHDAGWVEKWPELLKTKIPSCYVPPEPAFIPIEKPKPIYVPGIGRSKK